MTAPVDSDLMARLREAFAGKLFLTRAELAPVLRMTAKTLGKCEAAGQIASRRKGCGTKRPQRVYTLEDVAKATFLKAEVACRSTSPRVRASTSTTSGGEVIAFSARQGRRQKETQQR